MTRRIRDDLRGVVYVPGWSGVSLKAGDDVPDDVELGDHLLAEDEANEADTSEAPAGNASLEVWQEYAKSQGASDDDLDGMSRNELREQYGN